MLVLSLALSFACAILNITYQLLFLQKNYNVILLLLEILNFDNIINECM